MHVIAAPDPDDPDALPPPEQLPPPTGRGMSGHTSAGTEPAPPGPPPLGPLGGATTVGPRRSRQSSTLCCAESHATNSAWREAEHVGCAVSRQRRKASTRDEHEGEAVDRASTQLVAQSPLPEVHPACAILAQVLEQEAETSLLEQLSPHVAKGPAGLPEPESALPPQAVARQSTTHRAPQRMPLDLMEPLSRLDFSRSRLAVNRSGPPFERGAPQSRRERREKKAEEGCTRPPSSLCVLCVSAALLSLLQPRFGVA
jgi:hypothetical protein